MKNKLDQISLFALLLSVTFFCETGKAQTGADYDCVCVEDTNMIILNAKAEIKSRKEKFGVKVIKITFPNEIEMVNDFCLPPIPIKTANGDITGYECPLRGRCEYEYDAIVELEYPDGGTGTCFTFGNVNIRCVIEQGGG